MIKKMKQFIKNMKKRTLKFFVLFIILVFLPISFTVIFTYNNILDIVKQEKIEINADRLNKSVTYFDLAISKEKKVIQTSLLDDVSLRASFQKFKDYSDKQLDNMRNHMLKEFDLAQSNMLYVKAIGGITEFEEIYVNNDKINKELLNKLDKKLDDDFTQPSDSKWIYDKEGIYYNENKGNLIYIYNICQYKDENNKAIINPVDGRTTGRVYIFFDTSKVIDLLKSTITDEKNEIYVYDKNNNPIIFEPKEDYSAVINELKGLDNNNNRSLIKKTKDKEILMQLSTLESTDWYVLNTLPVSQMTKSVKNSLNTNIGVLIFISVLIAVWILVDIQVLANIKSEKDIMEYKLISAEQMNEKLRIYKHDFLNHLQIIWGLLIMKEYDNVIEYINKLTDQGENVSRKYSVGIPEIDSLLSNILNQAKQNDIEVEIDSMDLPNYLKIDIFDLCKILTNLTKNALYELEKSDSKYKLLSIYMRYELDEYIFIISNNTPLIDKELQDKIFEKGFTTKGNNGNGLGLYIVKKLVDKYNGVISLTVDEFGNHFYLRIR